MKSHLAIVGKSGNLALKPDASITVIEKNPMFNDVEMHSYPFELPFEQNRHLMKNIDDVNSTLRAQDVDGEPFTIIADGIRLRNTVMKVQSDVVMSDALSVNLDATRKTFKDMIQDMKCRDVTVDSNILIGEKIGDVEIDIDVRKRYNIGYTIYDDQYTYPHEVGNIEAYEAYRNIKETFQPPALGFSYPAKCAGNWKSPTQDKPITIDDVTINVPKVQTSYINTVKSYADGAKYCNCRICYSHHDRQKTSDDSEWESSDEIVQSDKANPSNGHDFSPYWMLDANRPASGICFYVGYFLERLFHDLGVAFDMKVLTNIEDFNYLAFFTTSCFFDTKNTTQNFSGNSFDEINQWLSSRGCGGQLNIKEELVNGKKYEYKIPKSNIVSYSQYSGWGYAMIEECGDIIEIPSCIDFDGDESRHFYDGWFEQVDIGNDVQINSIKACVQQMYANSENFPDVNVSEVIESLENMFGVRFCYDADKNLVTVKLLRDMFRQKDLYGNVLKPIAFQGKVVEMHKKTENIRGVRAKYSAESDAEEQRDNIRYGKRDYDTNYDYIDYKDGYVKLAAYADWSKKIDISDYTCYVDPATGDAYRIKINSEATTVVEMKPTGFEVGQYHGVEEGDCSKQAEDDDAIKEIVSRFEPIVTNNLKDDKNDILMVPFVDEDMEHELLPKIIQNSFSVGDDDYINVNYELTLIENYDPSSTDDGQSPLMHHDWGLTIGILRPASNSSGPYQYDNNYDGFGNSRWSISSADFCISSDSYDMFGNFIGTNNAGSFSLKPRAWKPFLYYIDNGVCHVTPYSADLVGQPVEGVSGKTWLIPCNDDERNAQGIITKRLRSRGYVDTFLIEYIHFLLNRQRYEVKALCTAAELANIPLNWDRFYDVDGKIGLFNEFQYEINEETGIGEVTIDFYAI